MPLMNSRNSFCLVLFVTICSLLVNFSCCLNPKLLNASLAGDGGRGFSHGFATWYGNPNGAGSDGGACGYTYTVSQAPFNSYIAAGNDNLYKGGKGCGACYQVACSQHPLCSENAVTVTITDSCPGCNGQAYHFDLSGTAFGALAKPGQANALRNVGTLNIGFRRVACNYRSGKIAFHVDAGANPYYFALLIEYENGDGDVGLVEVLPANYRRWVPMEHSWGATWRANLPYGGRAPFSIRVTTDTSKQTIVANNAIPANWVAGQTYWADANY